MVCDLRHARYIGLAKTRLQHVLTAAALRANSAEKSSADVAKKLCINYLVYTLLCQLIELFD